MINGTVHSNKSCLPTNIMEFAEMLIEHKRANVICFTNYTLQYYIYTIIFSSPIFSIFVSQAKVIKGLLTAASYS